MSFGYDELQAIESTRTRWRHKDSGELLVAVAVKDDNGVRSVLAVRHHGPACYRVAHPLDWMPESSFLRDYEVAA